MPATAWVLAALVSVLSLTSWFVADGHAAHQGLVPVAEETVPQGEDPPGADNGGEPNPGAEPGESLSDQLDRQHGVIEPPPTGDADIHVEPPNPDPGTTPVIPPPGAPGGDESIQPK